MAKSKKKTVTAKSGKPSLVQTVHGSKGMVCGKLAFKAQKAHRVLVASHGHGLPALIKLLADFARTGVVNPQSIYAAQIAEYNGNPMMELRAGPADQSPFSFGKAKAGMMAESLAAHTPHEIMAALAEVTDGHPMRLSREGEPEVVTQAPTPPAPAYTAPASAPVADATLAQKQMEEVALMRRLTQLKREVAQLRKLAVA